jgi:methylmalonyl-CoA mutase C-terminal domain/subunit
MRDHGMTDVPIFAGGIIPDDDVPALKQAGITGIFGPGTPMSEIVAFIRSHASQRVGIGD